jgi:hypothetical protein
MISYQLDNNVATIWEFEPEPSQIKLFFKLIRESVDNLQEEKKITHIRQIVGDNEDYYKDKPTWKIIYKYPNGNLLVECKITDFINNFAQAIGL